MPAVIPIIVGAVSAAGTVAAAKMTTNAAKESATTQANAATSAAALQDKQSSNALAFSKQQAETDWQNQEQARRANYDQWLSRENRASSLGQSVGLAPRSSPAYVAGIDPRYTGGGAPATLAGAAGPQASPAAPAGAGPQAVSASNGPIAPQVAAYFQARGVTPNPTSVGYWAQKWNEFGANDPAYFNTRLAQADEFGGGAKPAASQTLASAALPYVQPTLTPGLQMPGTLAGLAR